MRIITPQQYVDITILEATYKKIRELTTPTVIDDTDSELVKKLTIRITRDAPPRAEIARITCINRFQRDIPIASLDVSYYKPRN